MTSAIFLRGARGDEYVVVAASDALDMRSEWDRRRFIDDFGEAAIHAIVVERPRWLALTAFDDPHADQEYLEFALDESLRFGRLVPVRIEPTWRRLDPLPSVMLRDLIKPRPHGPSAPLNPGQGGGVLPGEAPTKGVEVFALRWHRGSALRGSIAQLSASVSGLALGARVEIRVIEVQPYTELERGLDLIAAEVREDGIELEWPVRSVTDILELPSATERSDDTPYEAPSFYFTVRTRGETFGTDRSSGLLQLEDFFTLRLLDENGEPIGDHPVELDLADGSRRSVRTDAGGEVMEEVPPGPVEVECSELPMSPIAFGDDVEEGASFRGTRTADASGLRLASGKRHRISGLLPEKTPATTFTGTFFALRSAFPAPGIVELVKTVHGIVDEDPEARIGLFGHADPSGEPAFNKKLTDRRAQAVYAMLTGDLDLLDKVARDDDWGLAEYQAMLRTLGNNPTAIDGELGPMTSAAIRAFRREYNEGVYHEDSRPRAHGNLPEGEALDEATKTAIRDAYQALTGGEVPVEHFHGPKFSGCAFFNPFKPDERLSRRVTLAIYDEDRPTEFPCTEGDHAACPLDDGGPHRCKFYRERIAESEHPETAAVHFLEFEWLRTLTGKAHLSAITWLPDSKDVEFEVQIAITKAPLDTFGEGTPPARGPTIAKLPGLIRHGIAYALWDSGPSYDPFDPSQWFGHPDLPSDEWLPPFQPPVFTVVERDYWGSSGPPGHAISRVHFDAPVDRPVLVLRNDGKMLLGRNEHAFKNMDDRVIAMTTHELQVSTDDEES
jgi:hypothetical protein